MSRLIDVEYEMKVYATVDLDTGEVVKVTTDDEGMSPTGGFSPALGSDPVSPDESDRAQQIAESDQDWPPWTRGY
jgi:hypothetical protein